MNFLKMFLRGVALLPSVVQGVEALYGVKSGAQKKDAALSIVQASMNVIQAVEQRSITGAPAFVAGLGVVIDGLVACLNASVWHKP